MSFCMVGKYTPILSTCLNVCFGDMWKLPIAMCACLRYSNVSLASMHNLRTTSSPSGRDVELTGYPIRMSEMLATMDGAGYIARRSLHNPANIRKAKKAIRLAFETQERGLGFSMVELLSSCPTNWKVTPNEALEFVAEHMIPVFPLGDYKVNPEIAGLRV